MKKIQIRKGILVLLSLLLVAVLAISCAKKTENTAETAPAPVKKTLIRLVVPSPSGDELTVKDEEIARRFNERAGGAYEIKVHCGGALVKIPEYFDAVRTGAVEMFDAAASIYAGAEPRFNLSSLPYLFRDGNAMIAAQDDIIAFYNEFCEKQYNQRVLGQLFTGSKGIFNNKKPVLCPEDTKGLLLGGADASIIAVATAIGAEAINIPWPDYYTSLDKGVIDGIIYSTNGTIANKLSDNLKYYTDLDFPIGTNMYSINLDIWNGMPKDIQDILVEEVQRACEEYSAHFIAQLAKDEETLKNEGITIHKLTPEEKEKFGAALKAYTDAKLPEFGEDGKKMKEIADKANAKTKS